MAKRIRLQLSAPLPTLRAWFLIHQNVTDIQSLKHTICTQLSALKDLEVSSDQLFLEMDDFELLEDTSIDLVREGDLLMLKRRDPAVLVGTDTLKRKASVGHPNRIQKRRRLSTSPKSSSSSSSSTSSSSSSSPSSTTSSSDSDSSASSDSREASSSVSALKSPIKTISSAQQAQFTLRTVPKNTVVQQTLVPPGQGKASTHSRNKRRKIKRQFTAVQTSFNGISKHSGGDHDPATPMETEGNRVMDLSGQPPLSTSEFRITCSSLGNKNKSKGFKKSMESAIPQKITFDSPVCKIPGVGNLSTQVARSFIPPSERRDLPRNIFVTSVDVEWRTGQGRNHWQDVDRVEDEKAVEEVEVMETLDPSLSHLPDWEAIEKKWERYSNMDISIKLVPDAIVAWKAFGLDPVTLTPQASMLHIGKVTAVDAENLLVQPLTRPGVGHAAFGRAFIEEEEEPISIPIPEIFSNGWKLITQQ
ncbi:hypothetical protein K439DRAFT_174719 [Ramaria rubella]|nr:hypothetical protein K439DRAFT_174719 [Ramaria rubella]